MPNFVVPKFDDRIFSSGFEGNSNFRAPCKHLASEHVEPPHAQCRDTPHASLECTRKSPSLSQAHTFHDHARCPPKLRTKKHEPSPDYILFNFNSHYHLNLFVLSINNYY